MFLLQVVRGLSIFFFPGGVQCNTVFGILSCDILITSRIAFNRGVIRKKLHVQVIAFSFVLISLAIFLHVLLFFLFRSLSLILFGQKILFIFPRQLLWNTSTFFVSLSIAPQHSDPRPILCSCYKVIVWSSDCRCWASRLAKVGRMLHVLCWVFSGSVVLIQDTPYVGEAIYLFKWLSS